MRWIVTLALVLLAAGPFSLAQGDANRTPATLRPLDEALERHLGPGPRGVDALLFELPPSGPGERPLPLAAYVPREGGPYPLVLFSHGLGLNETAYRELARSWASHGYVVVLPRHEDQDPPESWERLTPLPPPIDFLPNSASRARDLRQVLDGIEAMAGVQPRLEGRIDGARVAAAGHSFGTLGAQLVGGAASRVEELSDLADPRIEAILLFAAFGAGAAGLDADSWAGLETPILAMTGSNDPAPFGGDPLERLDPALRAASPDSMAFLLKDADHLAYLGRRGGASPRLAADRRANARVLREERRRRLARLKPGAAWTPGEMHFAAIASVSRSFLDATLKGEESAAEWLGSDRPARSFLGLIERVSSPPAASE